MTLDDFLLFSRPKHKWSSGDSLEIHIAYCAVEYVALKEYGIFLLVK